MLWQLHWAFVLSVTQLAWVLTGLSLTITQWVACSDSWSWSYHTYRNLLLSIILKLVNDFLFHSDNYLSKELIKATSSHLSGEDGVSILVLLGGTLGGGLSMAAAAGAGLPVLTGGGISSSAMDLPAFACFSRLLRVFRPRLKLCRKVICFFNQLCFACTVSIRTVQYPQY